MQLPIVHVIRNNKTLHCVLLGYLNRNCNIMKQNEALEIKKIFNYTNESKQSAFCVTCDSIRVN